MSQVRSNPEYLYILEGTTFLVFYRLASLLCHWNLLAFHENRTWKSPIEHGETFGADNNNEWQSAFTKKKC